MDDETLQVVEQVIKVAASEVVKRRRCAVQLLLNVLKNYEGEGKRKVWARSWLQRRDEGKGVLTMLFEELR